MANHVGKENPKNMQKGLVLDNFKKEHHQPI